MGCERRASAILVAGLALGCATGPREPAPAPRAAPASAPAPDTAQGGIPDAMTEADALAHAVVAYYGDASRVARAEFTFVFQGQRVVRRRHTRDFVKRWLRVDDGKTEVTLVNIDPELFSEKSRDPAAHPEFWAANNVPPEVGARAWKQWVNDWFWLVAGSKLLDPGTERSLDNEGALVVRFSRGGVTPGDTYQLLVEPSGLIRGWTYQPGTAREAYYSWWEPEEIGPLRVSRTHKNLRGGTEIYLEDVVLTPL